MTHHDSNHLPPQDDWHVLREQLQTLHRDVLDEPVPPLMREAAERATSQRLQAANQMRWGSMAATLVLAFGLGWVTHAYLPQGDAVVAAQAAPQSEFVRAAGFAHAVYLPEKRHPVEVGAAEQAHLVQWLSKRLGRNLAIPDLSGEGFALVGGRLLPGEGSARAQFMFEDAQGQRVTLYLGGVTQSGKQPHLAETRFQFDTQQGTSSFYWFDKDFGYALSGQLERQRLMALATAVYHQLQ